MKVLIVTFEYPPFSGGIATAAVTVAEGLARTGCEVRVLAPAYPGDEALDRTLASTTVRMRVGHGRRELVRFLPGFVHLHREISSFRPDVALLASDLAHGIGAVACGVHRVPYVPVVHGSEIAKHFPPRTLKQRLQAVPLRSAYARADRVVCVSAYVRGLMEEAGFDPTRLVVIRNGVADALADAPRDPARERSLRTRLGIGDRRVVLTFARLTPRKGQDVVIRALPAILRAHPRACYVVAGTGEDGARLGRVAAEMGVADAVVMTGRIPEDDKVALLDLCDVYVLPSREEAQRVEGLGIALLEAAARTKPLVAGRHGGVPEIVEHGTSGWLVDPQDASDVAARVGSLLADAEGAARMGRAAREMVSDRFLARTMAGEYRALLAEVAARR
ncbi:MAG: glycosyltransferase family 4 protein [Longimicrobiales bacterium]